MPSVPLVRRLLLWALVAGAAAAAAWRLGPAATEADVPGVPVIVVPGYDGTAESVAALSRHLRGRGRTVIPITLPERGRGPIEAAAHSLGRVVANTGADQVDLVGFSAGGVVVRAYAAGATGGVRRVVLLGAPNHGARIASMAASFEPSLCTGSCLQLSPGSSFLRRLNSGDETPGAVAYTSIWTSSDRLVTPARSAILEGANNIRVQDICPGARLAHGALVSDPVALGLVDAALAGRPPPSCRALKS